MRNGAVTHNFFQIYDVIRVTDCESWQIALFNKPASLQYALGRFIFAACQMALSCCSKV